MFIGIMQGRLLPPIKNCIQCFPKDRWREEFSLTKSLGLKGIEWIYESYGASENPLTTQEGIAELKKYCLEYEVEVRSVCADYFMNFPLLRCSELQLEKRIFHLKWLVQQASCAGMHSLVIPFVDHSQIQNEQEILEVINLLEKILPTIEEYNVELHLETSLSPVIFGSFLKKIPHPLIRANYDIGNSASLGYSIEEEFHEYGNRIGSIHIKDRLLSGGTVPLGKGNADFSKLQDLLKSMHYQRSVILQIARGVSGEEFKWSQKNIEILKTKVPWIFS